MSVRSCCCSFSLGEPHSVHGTWPAKASGPTIRQELQHIAAAVAARTPTWVASQAPQHSHTQPRRCWRLSPVWRARIHSALSLLHTHTHAHSSRSSSGSNTVVFSRRCFVIISAATWRRISSALAGRTTNTACAPLHSTACAIDRPSLARACACVSVCVCECV